VLAGERDGATGRYVTHFPVRAVRHVEVPSASRPRSNEAIALMPPWSTRTRSAGARKLSFQGQPVGYAPGYLVGDLDQLERRAPTPSFTVARVNPPPAPPHHRVLVRVEAAWPTGFSPFSGPQFERVAEAQLRSEATLSPGPLALNLSRPGPRRIELGRLSSGCELL
jgi:hypothetical protein